MKKIRIVLDSNTLNKLVNCSAKDIEILSRKCELLNCNTLIRELENIQPTNPELYNKICSILKKFQSCRGFVFSFANPVKEIRNENTHGFLTKNDIDKNINVKMLNSKAFKDYKSIHPNATVLKRESDRQIALIASLCNANFIVTNDGDFYDDLRDATIKRMKFDEFINWILNK